MKIIFSLFIGAFLFASSAAVYAQSGEITYILIRHAEKDTTPALSRTDVNLSPAGSERALRLIDTVRQYNPEQIFSTIFQRTRQTVTPLAVNLHPDYRLMIQFYDHSEMEQLAERLLKVNARTVLVVGHNNTTPQLANLLIKQEKYQMLPESEYSKMWIIKLKRSKGKADKVIEEKVITY